MRDIGGLLREKCEGHEEGGGALFRVMCEEHRGYVEREV